MTNEEITKTAVAAALRAIADSLAPPPPLEVKLKVTPPTPEEILTALQVMAAQKSASDRCGTAGFHEFNGESGQCTRCGKRRPK